MAVFSLDLPFEWVIGDHNGLLAEPTNYKYKSTAFRKPKLSNSTPLVSETLTASL